MEFVKMKETDGIGFITIERGKVNALTGKVIDEIRAALNAYERDAKIKSVILTGRREFFSFGFDIPHFLSYSKREFTDYLKNFTELYTYMFLYPKPLVAALNGHTIAGGCILALACDYRVMAEGKAKISINEIELGSTVFAGSTEYLRFWVGDNNASRVLLSGAMYSAVEAMELGMIDESAKPGDVLQRAVETAHSLGLKRPEVYANIKKLLRQSIYEYYNRREAESINDVVEIWYSEPTWSNLHKIKIR